MVQRVRPRVLSAICAAVLVAVAAVSVGAVSLDAMTDSASRLRVPTALRTRSNDLPAYIADVESADPFKGRNLLEDDTPVRRLTAEILSRGFKGRVNSTADDYLKYGRLPGIDASDLNKLPSLRKVTVVINNTELYPPHPRNRHGEQPANGTHQVSAQRYIEAHNHTADTSRHGVGQPGVEVSFPVPYHLFAMFDHDKSGTLNYREFLALMNYVNGDYVLPKEHNKASYRLLIETVRGTPLDMPVYVRFIGPTGVATSEKLLREGFIPGKDVISIDAEDVSVVTNIRFRLENDTKGTNDTWVIKKVSVSVHGRVTDSKAGPYTISRALHIPLSPTKLRLNESAESMAMGAPTDEWTEQHYMSYLQHVNAFNNWLDQHLEAQRLHNEQVAANVTAALRAAAANATNATNATATATAAASPVEAPSTPAASAVTSAVSAAVAQTAAPAAAPATASSPAPAANSSAPAPAANSAVAPAAAPTASNASTSADASTPSSTVTPISRTVPALNFSGIDTRVVPDLPPPLLAGVNLTAIAANLSQKAVVNANVSSTVTPIRISDVRVPSDAQAAEKARVEAYKKQMQADLVAQQAKEQKALDELLGRIARDQAAHDKAAKERASVEAAAELKRAQLEGAPELTFEQKLAALSLEMKQEKERRAQVNAAVVANAAANGGATAAALDGNPVLPVISSHPPSSNGSHMLAEHLPGASWAGETPKTVNPLANPPGPLQYKRHAVMTPDAAWGYAKSGRDWTGECKGQRQSPIFIRKLAARPSNGLLKPGDTNMVLHYRDVAPSAQLHMINDGRSLFINAFGSAGYVENGLDRLRYDVQKVMFHAPSEHAFDYSGREDGRFDLEMQIYHQRNGSVRSDDVLVVSIFFKLDKFDNEFLDSLDWAHLPRAGKKHPIPSSFTFANATGEDKWQSPYFSYLGSITTPPCTQGAQWRLIKNPQPISAVQLEKVNALFAGNPDFANGKGNNRGLQKFYNRAGGLTISHQ